VASTLRIEIVTPEKLVVSQDADYVEIPGKDGYMGILPEHAALLSELGEGELSYMLAGKKESCKVSGGYVEIRDNHVRVLADKVS
jgi:F-type H+-transporting ATPase subunit epsilon